VSHQLAAAIRASRLVMALLISMLSVFGDTGVEAQMNYIPSTTAPPGPPDWFITIASPDVCTLDGAAASSSMPDGTFLKNYRLAKTDVVADVVGSCDWYWGMSFLLTETRRLWNANGWHYRPGGISPYDAWSYYPMSPTQHMDTRTTDPWTGMSWTPADVEGRHRLDFQTVAIATNCSIPQYSTIVGQR
jgi:hypothetical protein